MTPADDQVLERLARMRAARADPANTSHPAIAAMAAGAGARLVADQNKARTILAERITRAAAKRRAARAAPEVASQ